MTCLEAGDHIAGGVQQLELLSGDPPPLHSPERVQEAFSVSIPSKQAIIVAVIEPRLSRSPFSL